MSAAVTNRAVTYRPRHIEIDVKPSAVPSPTTEQWANYSALYDVLNTELWAGKLPGCVLNFSRHKGSVGFFAADAWKGRVDDSKHAHEISINPEHMSARTIQQTVSTLAHEMCHLWQAVHGTPSRRGYHNQEWADEMKRIGLQPSTTGDAAGNEVGQKMTHYLIPGGLFDRVFRAIPAEQLLPWRARPSTAKEKKTAAAKAKVKYTCPQCGLNVWGKPDLAIACVTCDDFLKSGVED